MQLDLNLKKPYLLFVVPIVLAIALQILVSNYFLDLQRDDALVINRSGRQRMLSQNIFKSLLVFDNYDENILDKDKLLEDTKSFKKSHEFLSAYNKNNLDDREIADLLKRNDNFVKNVHNIIVEKSPKIGFFKGDIWLKEQSFLADMESVTGLFQKQAEKKITKFKNYSFLLNLLIIIIIFLEFIFIVRPAFISISKKNKKLHRLNNQLSDFAQITAHNLRSPIGNLGFLINFYENAKNEEEKDEIFSNFKSVAKNLQSTTNVLLESITIKSEGIENVQKIDLTKVFDHTKQLLTGEIKSTEAVVTSNFSEVAHVYYNPIYMDSIFMNLMGNALKYRHPDRIPEIHVKTIKRKNIVELIFTDNGLGINLKLQGSKIFKLHKTFHKHKDANGVGLFMTRNQIHAMGGDIRVESEEFKGSTFIVEIQNLKHAGSFNA